MDEIQGMRHPLLNRDGISSSGMDFVSGSVRNIVIKARMPNPKYSRKPPGVPSAFNMLK